MSSPSSRWPVRFWHALTDPHPAITDEYTRERVRVVAGVLVSLIPGTVVVVAAAVATGLLAGPGEGMTDPDLAVAVLVVLGLVAAYGLSRSRWHRSGAALAVTTLFLAAWLYWVTEADRLEQLDVLYFTLVPILMAALFVNLWATVVLGGANLTLLSLVLAINDAAAAPPDPGSEFVLIGVVFLSTIIATVGASMLDGDRRRMLAANESLVEAKRTQMQMLNNVAHDLASPLTPIRIQMYLLRRGATPEAMAKAADVVDRNVEHVGRLVQDLKDMAKAEAGMLKVRPEPIDVASLVEKAVEALAPAAEKNGVRIVADAAQVPAHADPQRVTQVIYNLVGNAIKFTPPEGQVTVRAWRHNGFARVEVEDTGRGLTPEEARQLFRPFVQVHDPKEVDEKGTGLGLFISKQLVEAHGGRIWVQSDGRERGSTFVFTLPASGAGAASAREGGT